MSESPYLNEWFLLLNDDYELPADMHHLKHLLVICRGCGMEMLEWDEKIEEIDLLSDSFTTMKSRILEAEGSGMELHWTSLLQESKTLQVLERKSHDAIVSNARGRDDLEDVYRKEFEVNIDDGREAELIKAAATGMTHLKEPPSHLAHEKILEPSQLLARCDAALDFIKPHESHFKRAKRVRERQLDSAYEKLTEKLQSKEEHFEVLLALYQFGSAADIKATEAIMGLAACSYDSPVQLQGDILFNPLAREGIPLTPDIKSALDAGVGAVQFCSIINDHHDKLINLKTKELRQPTLDFFESLLASTDNRISDAMRRHAQTALISARLRLSDDKKRCHVTTLPDDRLFLPIVVEPLIQVVTRGTRIVFETEFMANSYKDVSLHIPLRKHIMTLGAVASAGNELALHFLLKGLLIDDLWCNRQCAASVLSPMMEIEQVSEVLLEKLFDRKEHPDVINALETGIVTTLSCGKIADKNYMSHLQERAQMHLACSEDHIMWSRMTEQAWKSYTRSATDREFGQIIKKRNLVAADKFLKLRTQGRIDDGSELFSTTTLRAMRADGTKKAIKQEDEGLEETTI